MRSIMSKWGKHIAAIAVFLVLTVIYFSPAVFEGKVVRQGDTEKAIGMGNSQMDEYEKTANRENSAHGLMLCLAECLMCRDMAIRLHDFPDIF